MIGILWGPTVRWEIVPFSCPPGYGEVWTNEPPDGGYFRARLARSNLEPSQGAGAVKIPPPPLPLPLHFCCAAWNRGELGSTPAVIFSRTRPPDRNCGSGKLGTPCLRMQAENASACAWSCACAAAEGC